jgi:cyclic pyranopterin phosphate synthase
MIKKEIIAYELCGNVYLNITNRCTSECIFCRRRDSYTSQNKIAGIDQEKMRPELEIGDINSRTLSDETLLDNFQQSFRCSESSDDVASTIEQLEPLDEIIFGNNLRLPNEPVYARDLRLSKEPSIKDILNELEGHNLSKYQEVVFTGLGEPLLRFDEVLKITEWLTNKGISVRLDTNGHGKLLYPDRKVAEELACSGMKSVSISLNAHDENTYSKICRPMLENSYNSIFEFASDVNRTGMKLRFTCVNLPDVDIRTFRQIAKKFNAIVDVRALF